MNYIVFLFNMIEQVCVYTPLTLGACIIFSFLKIPFLSIESAYVLGALVASNVLNITSNPLASLFLALMASIIGGMVVGLITYCIHYSTKASFLLSNIISAGIFHGLSQIVINQKTHVALNKYDYVLKIIPSVLCFDQLTTLIAITIFFVLLFIFLTCTQLGYSWRFYGNNSLFFKNYGISRTYIELTGILVGTGLVGVSGFLNSIMNGFADITMGSGIVLLCLTGLILGKIIIKKRDNFYTPLIGIIFYFIIQYSLLQLSFDTRYFTMIKALLIFILLYGMTLIGKKDKNEFGL